MSLPFSKWDKVSGEPLLWNCPGPWYIRRANCHSSKHSAIVNPLLFRGRLLIFSDSFVHFDTQIWQPPYSGKFWTVPLKLHVSNFENLPSFCLNPPYFLDVNVGTSVQSKQSSAVHHFHTFTTNKIQNKTNKQKKTTTKFSFWLICLMWQHLHINPKSVLCTMLQFSIWSLQACNVHIL